VPVFSPSGWQGVINRRPSADGLTIVVSRIAGLAFCARLPDRCAIVSSTLRRRTAPPARPDRV
jgi:hypothetical protein